MVPGEAQLERLKQSIDRIEQHLLAKPEQKHTFSDCKPGKGKAVAALLSAVHIHSIASILSLPRFKPNLCDKEYAPFAGWSDDAREDDVAPQLLQHMQQQFQAFGVHFGAGGYELKDVRTQYQLGFTVEAPMGRLVFEGGSDAVVVTWGELLWPKQLRMVFEWKRPQELRMDRCLSGGTFQAQLQMLGALAHSHHPALVVVTDGRDFIVLQPYGAGLQYLQTLQSEQPGYLGPGAAFRFLTHHLLEVCSTHRFFSSAQPGLAVNDDLKQQLEPLLRVQQALGVDEGLAEQLQAVESLPEDDRLDAAAGLILAWRAGERTGVASANGQDA